MLSLAMLCLLVIVSVYVMYQAYRHKDARSEAGRRDAYGILLAIVLTPVLIAVLAFILKTPIQKGYFFSEFGILLNLIYPPKDLFYPLAATKLDPNQTDYTFNFKHKYIGNHQLEISFPRVGVVKYPPEKFEVNMIVTNPNDKKVLLTRKGNSSSVYLGAQKEGIVLITYSVPSELPIRKELTATVQLKGPIDSLLQRTGPAELTLTHGSDE